MIDFLAFLFAGGVGFGLSCWIFGTLLDNSNNIGDSKGDKRYYKAYASFTVRRDEISGNEKETFCSTYGKIISSEDDGPSGASLVRRLTNEEIAKYKKSSAAKVAEAHEDRINDLEDEFNVWESRNPGGNLSGIFKPLDDEEQENNKNGVSRR